MHTTKADPCSCELRAFFSSRFLLTRDVLKMTQMEFAEELGIDRRSYIDLEHKKNLCCAITLLTFLCYHCEDPLKLISDCKVILDKYR